jgi:hypothetical protein
MICCCVKKQQVLVLGSTHERAVGPMLQKNGHNFDVISSKGKKVKFTVDQAMKAQKGVEV